MCDPSQNVMISVGVSTAASVSGTSAGTSSGSSTYFPDTGQSPTTVFPSGKISPTSSRRVGSSLIANSESTATPFTEAPGVHVSLFALSPYT